MNTEKIGQYGKYKFRIMYQWMFGNICIETPYRTNLITNVGRIWLNNRMASNDIDPIKAIGVGKGTNAPVLADVALQTPFGSRKETTNTLAGSPDFWTKASAIFSSTEINDTTEVGIFYDTTGNNCIGRNIHDAITVPIGSTVGLDYVIGLLTSRTTVGWEKTGGLTNVYEISDVVGVLSVIETDTGNGYIKKTNTGDVDTTANSYYYDGTGDKLYVHCSDGAEPSTHTVIAITTQT